MTAKLHHTTWAVSAVAATSAATGYPASNILVTSVGRPWRSTAITTQNVEIDLGASRAQPTLCIQAPNAATCVLTHGTATYADTNAGTQTLTLDRNGRRKHSYTFPGSVRYIRLAFGATAPDDNAAHFELGAVYVFSSTLNLPADPLLGTSITTRLPLQNVSLPNGAEFTIERGPHCGRQRIDLRLRGLRTDDLDAVVRAARKAPCWLDCAIAANRELQWPVQHVAAEQQRNLVRANQDEASVPLLEVA